MLASDECFSFARGAVSSVDENCKDDRAMAEEEQKRQTGVRQGERGEQQMWVLEPVSLRGQSFEAPAAGAGPGAAPNPWTLVSMEEA